MNHKLYLMRKFPRTSNEVFPHGADYASALQVNRKAPRAWPLAVVFVLLVLVASYGATNV
jgi:hypothetical protein